MIEKCQGKPSQSPGWMVCQLCRHSWEESDPNHQCWRAAQLEKGGHKDDADKVRLELVPPELLEAVGDILTYGAKKYADRNWEHGMNWSRPFGALMRHMWAWWKGEAKDPETGRSHLWHAGCCIAFLIAYEQRGVGTDDRWKGPSK